MLIDYRVEINTINKKFALQHRLAKIKDATLLNILIPNSTKAFYFYAYEAVIKAKDS
jgi:hypothetical protein